MRLSRRAMLAGAASLLALPVRADAPLTSLRPRARISETGRSAQLIAQAGLSGGVGFVVADATNGEVLESIAPDLPLPPASVTKAVTACYGISALGSDFMFETCVFAQGDMKDGILDGNLILSGGGDPNLLTDDLAELAKRLKASGLTEVRGDFLVWDRALVNLDQIDDTQMAHLGYNPAVSGLNLNFNRVHFEWKQEGGDYTTALDARSENFRPAVTTAEVAIVDRPYPVFTYRDGGNVDEWTVARQALNSAGSRWLPVRHPALYAGEVFATFARSHGIVLKPPRQVDTPPQGKVLAKIESAPLTDMLRDMLRYSTNLTAEAVGLTATRELTGQMRGLRTSALGMARWAQAHTVGAPFFADHSGLSDSSRLSAAEMVRLLTADGLMQTLRPLLKQIVLVNDQGRALPGVTGDVVAKTGTLNFVSSLAGYIRTATGRDLAFAFFGADLPSREEGKRQGGEQPRGSLAWNTRAKRLQQKLLQHWMTV